MKNKILLITSITIVGSLITACGGKPSSKNPLEDYESLSDYKAPYEQEVRQQKYDTCSAVVVVPPTLIISEGQSLTQDIYVRGVHVDRTEGLVAMNLPASATKPIKVGMTKDGLLFRMKFSAPQNSLEEGQNFSSSEFELVASSQSKNFVQCPEKVGFVVIRSQNIPVITKVSGKDKVDLEAAKDMQISVEIQAKNLSSSDDMDLFFQFDDKANSKELPHYNLSQALEITNLSKVNASTYRATLTLNSEILRTLIDKVAKSNPQQTEFRMLTQFVAFNNRSSMDSNAVNYVLTVNRKVDASKDAAAADQGATK